MHIHYAYFNILLFVLSILADNSKQLLRRGCIFYVLLLGLLGIVTGFATGMRWLLGTECKS